MKYLITTCLLGLAFSIAASAENTAPMATSGQPTDTTTGMTAGPEAKTTKAKKPKHRAKKQANNKYGTGQDNLSNRNAAPEKNPAAIDGEPSGAMGTVSPVETPMGLKRRFPSGEVN